MCTMCMAAAGCLRGLWAPLPPPLCCPGRLSLLSTHVCSHQFWDEMLYWLNSSRFSGLVTAWCSPPCLNGMDHCLTGWSAEIIHLSSVILFWPHSNPCLFFMHLGTVTIVERLSLCRHTCSHPFVWQGILCPPGIPHPAHNYFAEQLNPICAWRWTALTIILVAGIKDESSSSSSKKNCFWNSPLMPIASS